MRTHPALLREPRLTPADVPPFWAAVLGGGVAAALAFGGAAAIARCGPVDPPGDRTSHDAPTPTSGGLAILAGACAGWLVGLALNGGSGEARGVVVVLACAAALALLGAVDDLYDLPATSKLAAMAAAAIAAIVFATPAGRALTAPSGAAGAGWLVFVAVAGGWLLLVTNAVNFMDGANGLVAGSLAIAFAALALGAAQAGRPQIALCALAACAAHAGFLPWNLGGRLFQGDAGALPAGFLFAGLCLLAADALGPGFGALALSPLLLDVLHTLLRRARAGSPLMSAHREHLYQRWLQASGASHEALAWRVWALVAAGSGAALLAARWPTLGQLQALLGVAALLSLGWVRLSRRVDAKLAADAPAPVTRGF